MKETEEKLKELYFKLIRVEAFASVSDVKVVNELREAKELCSELISEIAKNEHS